MCEENVVTILFSSLWIQHVPKCPQPLPSVSDLACEVCEVCEDVYVCVCATGLNNRHYQLFNLFSLVYLLCLALTLSLMLLLSLLSIHMIVVGISRDDD